MISQHIQQASSCGPAGVHRWWTKFLFFFPRSAVCCVRWSGTQGDQAILVQTRSMLSKVLLDHLMRHAVAYEYDPTLPRILQRNPMIAHISSIDQTARYHSIVFMLDSYHLQCNQDDSTAKKNSIIKLIWENLRTPNLDII